MKLKFLPIMLLSLLALVSCSDDDDDNRVICPVETAKHFTGNELELTFSGNRAIGKDVLFTPDANNVNAATLTFLGERFDVEKAMQRATEASGYLTSSVFAGEPEVNLPITMVIEGDKGTFEGKSESKYYTFDYRGTVLESQLSIEISNVLLKNSKLSGTSWVLEPIEKDKWGNAQSTPLITNWESDSLLNIEFVPGQGTKYEMTQILTLITALPVIPVDEKNKISIMEIVSQLIQEVSFEGDGNLAATYLDMKTKKPVVSPKYLAQYVVLDDTNMKLVLNPFAIAANVNKTPKDPSQMSEIMKGLAPMILESLNANKRISEGIEMKYNLDGDKLSVVVNEDLFLPVLKTFAPMLENPDLIKTITDKIKENPDMTFFAPIIESCLKQIPGIINTTTKIEVGFKFNKK